MPADDNDLFRRAMQDISPLETEPRVLPSGRRLAAVSPRSSSNHSAASPPGSHHASLFVSDEPWILQANGLSHDYLRRLSSGRMPPDFELDLHGKTRDESCQSLEELFAMAALNAWRVLSIIHGRGLHSSKGRSVLRKATYDWLRHGPCSGRVLAVVPGHGSGGGSCLVLLRRSRA